MSNHTLFPLGWTLAKHCIDWSFRRRGEVYVISVATIIRQGYSCEQVRAALAHEADWTDGVMYRGNPVDSTDSGWRVHVTMQS